MLPQGALNHLGVGGSPDYDSSRKPALEEITLATSSSCLTPHVCNGAETRQTGRSRDLIKRQNGGTLSSTDLISVLLPLISEKPPGELLGGEIY